MPSLEKTFIIRVFGILPPTSPFIDDAFDTVPRTITAWYFFKGVAAYFCDFAKVTWPLSFFPVRL